MLRREKLKPVLTSWSNGSKSSGNGGMKLSERKNIVKEIFSMHFTIFVVSCLESVNNLDF